MKYSFILIVALFFCGCANSNVTNFRVTAIAEEGVSETTARKIAFSYAAQRAYQKGKIKVHVYPRDQQAKKECREDSFYLELHGEFCNANYFIATEYDFGYSSYLVLEKCNGNSCYFSIGQVDIGIEE